VAWLETSFSCTHVRLVYGLNYYLVTYLHCHSGSSEGWIAVKMCSRFTCCLVKGGHLPGKPGKVTEFKSGQGEVRENVFSHA